MPRCGQTVDLSPIRNAREGRTVRFGGNHLRVTPAHGSQSDGSASPADQFGQIVIDPPPVTDGHDTDNPMRPIHGVGDAEAADAILQEPFEFPFKGSPIAGSLLMARSAALIDRLMSGWMW